MNPARILIVDDEAPARQRLRDVLDDIREQFPLVIADEAANGAEAIEIINNGNIDIVLCDIRMPIMDGIEFARHLATHLGAPKLIFTTAYDQYAVRAFELNAVDYLMKPIRQERLFTALNKARAITQQAAEAIAETGPNKRKHLSIHERGKIVLVPLADILYLRAELKYVTVKTATREFLLEEPLSKLEEEFAEHFTRIHRSILVTTAAITGFEKVNGDGEEAEGSATHWVVALKGCDEKLPVSRRQQSLIKNF